MRPTLKYYNTKSKALKESELFDDDTTERELKMHIGSNDLLKEDDEPEEQPEPKASEEAMDEQQLRIESLKIAVKIAKLFDQVQPSDLIEMSDEVFKYVQHQSLTSGEWDPNYGLGEGDEETPAEDEAPEETEETPDEVEDFNIEDLEDTNDEKQKDVEQDEPEEDKEDKEKTEENGNEIPQDIFDFTI
jgi:hypothetical protein